MLIDFWASANSFDDLLPPRSLALDAHSLRARHSGETLLITGAGGSVGSTLAKAIASARPRLLLLLDHSEPNLHQIQSGLAAAPNPPPHLAILGDAGDRALLEAILEEHRPSIIYHAGAFKHVPLTEANPFAAVRNNALATWELARICAEHRVPQLLLISTDKAANPRGIMGASKRLAELAVLRWNTNHTQCRALRLGNVLGSHGSVLPLFLWQIARGGPVTVTHRHASRYFLTMDHAVSLLLAMAAFGGAGGLFLPEMGAPVRILDLAERLIHATTTAGHEPISIKFTGLRPGEKLAEDLLSARESVRSTPQPGILEIVGPQVPAEKLDQFFRELAVYVEGRDLAALLDSLRAFLPEYQISECLLRYASRSVTEAAAHD